ncbi:hypothetical protein KCP76_25300 [Salmonella enterica subsp. enterica serovar Weltevreden]|nr:hypothetical protein KCP76_25300 [Salmonella enterica subsp. enterica serovar Weltevreden]
MCLKFLQESFWTGCHLAHAERYPDLTSVRSTGKLSPIGYGLVVGLTVRGRPDDPDAIYHPDAE